MASATAGRTGVVAALSRYIGAEGLLAFILGAHISDVFGVYIHFPFCASRCGYCDFYSTTPGEIPHVAYADAVEEELERRAPTFADSGTLASLYVGGGTPSLWDVRALGRILERVRATAGGADPEEITLELNPGTASPETFRQLREIGFNRLSVGIQSLDDNVLRYLSRAHDARAGRESVRLARAAGFENISCDLIFGFPGQDTRHHEDQLRAALELGPDHLSVYGLSLPPSTSLRRAGGSPPPDDTLAAMMDATRDLLSTAEYPQYEVSSYAATGFQSVHNLGVWAGRPYLGLGAGAHSMVTLGRRTWRSANPAVEPYLTQEFVGSPPVKATARVEIIEEPWSRHEVATMALRTTDGLRRDAFHRRFGKDIMELYGQTLVRLEEWGLLRLHADRVAPTARGLMFADEIAVRMIRER